MDQDGDLLVVDAEGLEFEKALAHLDQEIVVVVHLFDDFDNVRNQLVPDSIMAQYGGND